jgi:RNA polymerase sigma-70 factor, ECF subfamily
LAAERDAPQEEGLMAAYAAGDARAFESLFRLLAPRVHGFFARTFGEPAVADDLTQQTFLKIHKARASYRAGAPVRPWIFSIAARVRLDELRRRKRAPEHGDEESLARADEAGEQPAAPDELLAAAGQKAAVQAALKGLPESQRVVLHLHRWEGLSFAEIAGALGTTEGAVKLRAFRAYERLRVLLQPLIAERAP